VGAGFDCLFLKSWGATYITFGEEIGQSLALQTHLVDFRYGRKSEAKFRTYLALKKLREGRQDV